MPAVLHTDRGVVRDLCSLLHLPIAECKILAVLRAYMDESGIHAGSNICAIAGAVGSESEWETLERRWKQSLVDQGVSVFHMAEFENRQGAFEGWSNERRRLFLGELVGLVKARDVHCVGSALVKQDYERLSEDQRIWMTHGNAQYPYFLCFQHCIVEACHFADGLAAEEKVAFVFDRQQEFAAEATRLYNDLKDQSDWQNHERLGDVVAFASKRETVPLQIADLMAYECYKHLDNRLFHSERPTRWPLRQLEGKFSGKYFDSDGFSKLLALRPAAS